MSFGPIIRATRMVDSSASAAPMASPADAAQTTAFLARTSGLDATHVNAYKALINGLVSDNVWSLIDVLQIYATQNSATAVLNLASTSFTANPRNSPTFTTDRGFTAIAVSSSDVDTGYNPFTAGGNYTQNAASIWVWSLTAALTGGNALVFVDAALPGQNIFPLYSDTNTYIRVNDNPETGGFALGADATGFFLGNRSGPTARQGYRNKVSIGTYPSSASQAIDNVNYLSTSKDAQGQVAAWGAGGNIDAVQDKLYDRLRTYMTAVGVP